MDSMLVEAEIPAAYAEGMDFLLALLGHLHHYFLVMINIISTYYHMPIILQQNLHTYYSVHYHL